MVSCSKSSFTHTEQSSSSPSTAQPTWDDETGSSLLSMQETTFFFPNIGEDEEEEEDDADILSLRTKYEKEIIFSINNCMTFIFMKLSGKN